MATPLEGERDGRRVEKVKRGVEKEEREIRWGYRTQTFLLTDRWIISTLTEFQRFPSCVIVVYGIVEAMGLWLDRLTCTLIKEVS